MYPILESKDFFSQAQWKSAPFYSENTLSELAGQGFSLVTV